MAKAKKDLILEKVRITAVAAEGKSLARVNEKVLFVEQTAPGDLVDVQVFRKKRSFMQGNALHFHELSPIRQTPFCQHFGTCGGCKWQHIQYAEQLKFKQQEVVDHFERIGKLVIGEVLPILACEKDQYYRNKLEFTFSNKGWKTTEELNSGAPFTPALGFHVPGKFDKVLNVAHCFLQEDPSNEIRNFIRSYAIAHQIPFFDLREQTGVLRNLLIRISNLGELMVILSVKEKTTQVFDLLKELTTHFPQITSLFLVENQKRNDTLFDQDFELIQGKNAITEQIGALKFSVGPKSFYQTNSTQVQNLYQVVKDMAMLTGEQVVYDLYTGTGTIANFVADKSKFVIGVEYVESAIEDAKKNSLNNQIVNTRFFAGDMKDVLTPEFISENGLPDVVITDPPRAGMHPDVVQMLRQMAAPKIVYVSCNSATQARDIALLSDLYQVEKIRAVDMFPHTHHIENVALLVRK